MNDLIEKSSILVFSMGILLAGCQQRPSSDIEQSSPAPEVFVPSKMATPEPTRTLEVTSTSTESLSTVQVEITFIDNDGFLITSAEDKILIDALYEGGGYNSSPPSDVLSQAIVGDPPFDGIDLFLITHEHSDHFSAELVLEFMQNNPETILVSTKSVVEELKARGGDLHDRAIPIELREGESTELRVVDILLEVLYISHADPDLLNLGFILNLSGLKLFHAGDLVAMDVSVADLLAYELPQKQLDVAFIPLYMFQSSQYHAHIREGIMATYLIPMHYSHKFPPQIAHPEFPEAILFPGSMETWRYPSETSSIEPGSETTPTLRDLDWS